ncbi:MAG: pirin family protein [Treponema sp.]|nr:pirin family protein [Treponema sp.]
MHIYRNIRKIVTAHPVIEGAGVHLQRAIGFDDPYQYDPFLLFDDFRSDTPADYIKGFPWHPHRGIETITYVLKGKVNHEDSMGNRGSIGAGDIQWMTAGSGIYHQEMPEGSSDGAMYGFQLWINLPSKDKMTVPRYRGFTAADISEVKKDDGILIKVIAGSYEGITGPVTDVVTAPEYYDISIPPEKEYIQKTKKGATVIFYVFDGEAYIETSTEEKVQNRNLILFADGDAVKIRTKEHPVQFLMMSGTPIKEQIAWYGPIVMNTDEELQTAFRELEEGTFVKAKAV